MKVLVVGGGGREHALVWALSRSSDVRTLRCAPGNAGIADQAECVAIDAENVDALMDHATSEGYDLVVVGPEVPLVSGLSDRLRDSGMKVFGPSAAAAEIEGSKVFAKEFMTRHGIPTADYAVFDNIDAVRRYLETVDYPVVVKADGLAAGKGVIIAPDLGAASTAAEGMLSGESFGEAGRRVIVEEMLRGREVSFFVLSDGAHFLELATCQDYKRALDGDRGLNTGGMGTYSPSVYLDEPIRRQLVESVVEPTIHGLRSEDRPYQGVLYVGAMLTEGGPKVLEYNARFGDPETQVLMPRLDGDWLPLLLACDEGGIERLEPRWKTDAAVCVVMASGGYPGGYEKGRVVDGVDKAGDDDVIVFHAGTGRDVDGRLVTTGGRVLGVTALGAGLAEARQRAYEAVSRIKWADAHHRTDIGLDAVMALKEQKA